MSPIILEIPIVTKSEANMRSHWSVKAKRVRAQRLAVTYAALAAGVRGVIRIALPATVTLTRIAPRELDGDNCQSAMKGVRDQVADLLGLPNDRDPLVEWRYMHERGKPRYYGVRVTIAPRNP